MSSKKDRFKNIGRAILNLNLEEVFTDLNSREIRASLILFLSISFFFMIWLPWGVIFSIMKARPEKVSLPALLTIFLLLQVDSMIHPFLYIRSVGDVKEILLRWMSCCSNRKPLRSALTQFGSFGSNSQTHSTKPISSVA